MIFFLGNNRISKDKFEKLQQDTVAKSSNPQDKLIVEEIDMGFFDQLKDVNQMRQQAKQMQLMLANEEVMGQSKDAFIRIVIDGNQNVKSVEVIDDIVGDRKKIAQDIREALNDVNENYKKLMASKFGNMLQ